MVKFPHDPEYEKEEINSMTAEKANETLTKTMGELEAYKRRISKNARKSMKGKVATSTATAVAVGTPVTDDPTNPDNDVSGNASVNESATDEDPEQNEEPAAGGSPLDPSSSDDDDSDSGDPRLRTSKKDKRTVRGRTP